jgi:hypothetical protein
VHADLSSSFQDDIGEEWEGSMDKTVLVAQLASPTHRSERGMGRRSVVQCV